MLHRRCPMGVFSHDEAFYYYGLTDREPLVHTLTIYSGYNVHRLKEDGYKVYTVKKELLDVGKQIVKSNQGNEIPMYDLERTICDLVRSRSSIEVQDANVGRLITPLKIDISTGDVITPRAIEFNYDLLLEDRSISLWSYNLETILAEKLQTVLARGILNTRMRDFYDIRMLLDTYEDIK